MTIITSQEIAQFRSELANNPDAMKALDTIEDCEGNLEDAAIALAIRAGQQPQRDNAEWLDALARKCRAVICQKEFREDLLNGSFAPVVAYLGATPLLPGILATPVLMYVMRQGVDNFCEPLESRL
ncbi:MAG: hypothetical protein KME25_09980 [Symplocastrum torsivum CPER-KK1]|jgi:hypothetical protein|uniref:Uncharacterized protein n=1 Tax=Symplocastrum torsivum CPER-KK1 TaxID=450513 RepID=A0A951U8X7_9CYAN|nr:hypothetical protein [Microcoleus sp. FACHB-SPT15]MBD1807386.1 hypothetical protein [Microcoleus sp. FACHB-SPT15]MBW4544753.1 hypothetical protein [Symplocastrum torsivum CPER-KK1]